MKKRGTPFAALLMTLVMLFSCIPGAFAATEPYVESDTTANFTKAQGDYYWFKFTVHDSREDPQIAAGNGSVLKTGNCKKLKNADGEDEYRFQVWAVGNPGEASAIYTTLPGQKPVKHCVITIGQPLPAAVSPAPKAQTETSTAKQSRTIYITRTGKKYHYNNHCNGGTYYESTLDEALALGLGPCKKCVG